MDLMRIQEMINSKVIKAIDFKYVGLDERWYHISFPATRLEKIIEFGIPLDGSSMQGMSTVADSDLVLMPDLSTAHLDPVQDYEFAGKVLRILSSICDAETRLPVKKDSRSVALRAQKYLESTGIADTSYWLAEMEFYILEEANSFESDYNAEDEFYGFRLQMCEILESLNIDVGYHQQVRTSSQQRIATELLPFPKVSDDLKVLKNIIKRVASHNDLLATYAPKPFADEDGNGLHLQIMLRKNGKNIFWKKGGFADLSDEAIWFMQGILRHGRSLAAFTNPTIYSYERLVPGLAAPTKLFYALGDRTAAIRIPKHGTTEDTKTIEYRVGDATCNSYLAMSALLLAGLDGIKRKLDNRQTGIESLPENLEEALDALEADYEYLLAGDVFNQELIDAYIAVKR